MVETKHNPRAQRRLTREALKTQALLQSIGIIETLLKELVRASESNPIIGITISILTADISYKLHLITKTAYIGVMVAIGASEAGSIINDISDLIPSFKKASDDSTPSGRTFVYADSSDDKANLGDAMEASRMGQGGKND